MTHEFHIGRGRGTERVKAALGGVLRRYQDRALTHEMDKSLIDSARAIREEAYTALSGFASVENAQAVIEAERCLIQLHASDLPRVWTGLVKKADFSTPKGLEKAARFFTVKSTDFKELQKLANEQHDEEAFQAAREKELGCVEASEILNRM